MITLRSYCSEDLDEVAHLWYSTWHQTFPSLKHPEPFDAWRTRFRDDIAKHETIWVAEQDRKIVGFLSIRERDGYIDQIFVDTQFHRQGIGTALLNKAKQRSPRGLSLDTLQQNREARAFYEHHGFHAIHSGINTRNGQPNVTYQWKPDENSEK